MLSHSCVEVIYLYIKRVFFTYICGGYLSAYSKCFDVDLASKNDNFDGEKVIDK